MSGIKTPILCRNKLNITSTLIQKCYPNAFKVVKGLKTYQKSQHTWETLCPHAWLQPCSTQRSTDSWRGEQRSTFKEKGEVGEIQCVPAARTSFLHIQFLQCHFFFFGLKRSHRIIQNETWYGYFTFVRQMYICSFDVGAVWKGKERPQQECGRWHMTAAESLSCWWSFPQTLQRRSMLISSTLWLRGQILARAATKSTQVKKQWRKHM